MLTIWKKFYRLSSYLIGCVMASFTIEEITILSDPFINASVGKLNNLKYENV